MPRKTDLDKLRALQAQEAAAKDEEAARRERDRQLREAKRKVLHALLTDAQQRVGELAHETGLIPLDRDGVPQVDAALVRKGFTLLATLIRNGQLDLVWTQYAPDVEIEREVQALIDTTVTLVLVGDDGEPLSREA